MTSDRGSVFVESLVAVAVVAVAAAALFALASQDAQRRGLLEQRRLALLVARSHLDAAGTEGGAGVGRSRGEDAGLVWEVDSEPATQAGISDAVQLRRVLATVRDHDGRTLARLATLRVEGAL